MQVARLYKPYWWTMYPSVDPSTRLINRSIVEGQCIVWTGPLNNKGYGYTSIDGQRWYVHRLSFVLANQVAIPEGLDICHSCDVPLCINPDHLWVGTRADNMADSAAKGRNPMQMKTHCPRGHAYDELNTRIYRSMRYCRLCMLAVTHERRGNCPANSGGTCIHT